MCVSCCFIKERVLSFNKFSLTGVVAYNISQPSLRIALSLQALIGQTLDAVVSYFVGRALKSLLVAPRLAHLIHLLQGKLVLISYTVFVQAIIYI